MNAIRRHLFVLIVLATTMVLGMGLAVMPASAGLARMPGSSAQEAPVASARGERVALLIGNSNYKGDPSKDTNEWSRLQNAAKDANDIAKELKALGFLAEDIEVLNNATKDQIYAALERLNKRVAKAKQVVFYFGGHGMQLKTFNYMIPVDARKDRKLASLKSDAIPLEEILQAVSEGDGLKVVMIDACRTTDGYDGKGGEPSGLARPDTQKISSQTLVVFAAAANQIAADGRGHANGYFAQGLLEGLRLPNPSFRNVMKQAEIKVASLSQGRQDVTAYAGFRAQDAFLFGPVKAIPEPIDPHVAELQKKYDDLLRNQQNQPIATRPQPSPDVTAAAEKLSELEGYVLLPGGVARDKKTGLEWMRCSLGQSWDGNTCQGEVKELTFEQAQQAARDLNAQGGFAGKTNWRVPSVLELFGLVVCSQGAGKYSDMVDGQTWQHGCLGNVYARPTIAHGVFPNTPGYGFWSSSVYAALFEHAWRFSFNDGTFYHYSRNQSYAVRLVQQNQPIATRPQPGPDVPAAAEKLSELEGFVLLPGGVARDKKTGLEWMRCSLGQSWDGNTCQVKAKTFTFKQAQQAAKDLNAQGGFAGKTNWRVPTVLELFGLVVCSKGIGEFTMKVEGKTLKIGCLGEGYASPTIAQGVFPNMPDEWFWTSSGLEAGADFAWYVFFSSGGVYGANYNDLNAVRLVR